MAASLLLSQSLAKTQRLEEDGTDDVFIGDLHTGSAKFCGRCSTLARPWLSHNLCHWQALHAAAEGGHLLCLNITNRYKYR